MRNLNLLSFNKNLWSKSSKLIYALQSSNGHFNKVMVKRLLKHMELGVVKVNSTNVPTKRKHLARRVRKQSKKFYVRIRNKELVVGKSI